METAELTMYILLGVAAVMLVVFLVLFFRNLKNREDSQQDEDLKP